MPSELIVMTSGAFTAPNLALVPQLALVTGRKNVTATTDMETGTDFIPARLQRGDSADVVIVAEAALLDMIRDGHIAADSRTALARSAIGMAVRTGAPKPGISTVDALKRTLLQAGSVAYSASVSGHYFATELFQRLGIAGQMAGKCLQVHRERVGAVVARGDAEIGCQQISALLPVPGIDYAGPLPSAVQRVSVFAAGVTTGSRDASAAHALIRFLTSPQARFAISQSGLDPVGE